MRGQLGVRSCPTLLAAAAGRTLRHQHAAREMESGRASTHERKRTRAHAATRDACFAAMGDPATMATIVEDEEKLFDRSRMRTFSVSESRSEMPPLG